MQPSALILEEMEKAWQQSEPKQINHENKVTGQTGVHRTVKYAFDNPLTSAVQGEELSENSLPTADTQHNSGIVREGTFRLLDLPRELRDLIYEQAIKNTKTAGLRNPKTTLYAALSLQSTLKPCRYATNNAIVLVNKQVREEYTERLCSAPEVVVNVQISEELSFQHAIQMINSWTTRPNGSLAKCPRALLTINLVLHDWDEVMIHPDSYLENGYQVTQWMKQWLRTATEISKAPNAPEIKYTAQGTVVELWDFLRFMKRMKLNGDDAGCVEQRDDLCRDVKVVFKNVDKWEIEEYHRNVANRA